MQEIMGEPAFILRFLQCRDEEWIGKVRLRVLRVMVRVKR